MRFFNFTITGFFLAVIGIAYCSAQGNFPTLNFNSLDYGARRKNWDISQDKRGLIYSANNAGLLQFNGSNWELYPSPNRSEFRSVYCKDDKIYTGCYREFGYWERDSLGRLNYSSLVPELSAPLEEEEEIWNIEEVGKYLVFQTKDNLIFYDTKGDSNLKKIPLKTDFPKLFVWDDRLFYQKIGKGIWEMNNGNEVLIAEGPGISDRGIVGFFKQGSGWLAINEDAEFFLQEEGTQARRWFPSGMQKQGNPAIYTAFKSSDGRIYLGTIGNGLIILNEDGTFVERKDRSAGLNNNTVLSINEDASRRIWLGLDNGISVVFPESPFREYADILGRIGVVHAALERNDTLFLGTNQGLFYSAVGNSPEFNLFKGSEGQVWDLMEVEGDILVGHHRGTFVIRGTRLEVLSGDCGTWGFRAIPSRPDLLLQGTYEGLDILERGTGNRWKLRNHLNGFSVSSRFFEWSDDGFIFVNHDQKGCFLLQPDEALRSVRLNRSWEPLGHSSSLISNHGDILYANSGGVFFFEPSRMEWLPHRHINELLNKSNDSLNSILLQERESDDFWALGNRSIFRFSPNMLNGELELTTYSISRNLRRTLGTEGFETLARLNEEQYLLSVENGFLLFYPEQQKPSTHEVYLIQGTINPGRKNETPMPPTGQEWEIRYGEHSIRLDFGVSEVNKYQDVSFRYRLDGELLNPESWTEEPHLYLSQLSSGRHELSVQSRIGDTMSTNELVYTIDVIPPWYNSRWAWAAYFAMLFGALYGLHQAYRWYYEREKKKLELNNRRQRQREQLEAEKRIASIELEKMQQEMDSKNRELSSSTMNLIRKNEILNHIKEKLLKSEMKDKKPLLDIIDKNLSNEDDWRIFEQAFNNADKDFLRKLKEVHPDLTPHDLRICAYLRLNLSSKEIAPLLNISVKSVEVKRYRLRKKLGLSPNQGLIDYILRL